MKLYARIHLHSNNSVLVIIYEQEEMVYKKRLANKLDVIIKALEPYYLQISSIAVKSTFNWYWLVDGFIGNVPVSLY